MKKRNRKRILAGFLALLLVLTSFAWDFGGADVAKAQETTSAIKATEDSLNINFDNIDITELDDNGYTSTRFKSSTALVGEVNQKVSEHWFSGDGTDTPYGDADETTITGKNIGLKSNDIADSESRTVMYTPCSYEDFMVSAEVYYGAYSGIVIGEKNVYPTTSGAASSVAVFFNGGRIHIMGAVDRDSAKIMRGSQAAIANNGNEVGYKIFNNGSGDTIKSDAGNVYTLNVKKTGNHLIIWYSGGTGLITIKLTDSYRTGAIGIQSKGYDGECGGFKSLSIEKVHATETHNLDNADITELDNLGYSATFGGTVVNNSVGNAFFSGTSNSSGTLTSANEGLKGTTTGTSVSGLNIPYIYENFRLEAEVYSGQLIGVAVGNASSTPRTANMLSAFYNMNGNKIMLQMEGAYSGSWTHVGGAAGTNNTQWRPTLNGSVPADTKDVVYTLVLEVRDGKVTMWVEGYDGYVTATLADTYVTEKIALIARHSSSDKGGIKGYTITNLDAGDTQNFDNVVLSNLDAAGYKARKDGGTLATVSDSELWFSGDSTNYSDSEQYKNIGLKPSNTDTTREILNTPHTFENFRLETDVYHGQVLGVKIGQEEKGTQVGSGTVTSGSVSIYINGEYLSLCGAINYATAEYNGVNAQTKTDGWIQYKPTGNSAKWNQARTLIIEVQDGVLSVAFADLNHTLKVELDSSYQADSIAFFARRYDTANGSAGGGLKGYTLEKLPSANQELEDSNTGTTVDVDGYTDFDKVDVSILDEKGFSATQFDTSNSNAVVAADQIVSTYWFAGKAGKSANDGLKPRTVQNDSKMTILNTPYTAEAGYEDFRVSTEVYWGASTGIVLGAKNVLPRSTTDSAVQIFFNANQIQLTGAGIDPETAVVTGGASWNPNYLTTFIFKPDASFTVTKGSVYKLNVEMKDGVITVWVDGHEGSVTVKTTDTFKQESIALMARQYDGDGGGLKSLMVEKMTDVVVSYTADEFATYRSTDGYTAPTYKNYLFSGWFTDLACTKETAVSANTTSVNGTVYAKFVPRYVLDVKAQVSSHLLDENLKDDTSGGIRFLTTIDSKAYSQVGFKVSYDKGDGNGVQNKTSASNKVYKNLFVTIGDAEGGAVEKDPTEFCDASILFKACTIKTVAEELYDMEFTVTPFWKTLDGTEVSGDAVVKTVDQGISAAYLEGKTALFLGDSIMKGAEDKPANDFNYLSWAGRLDRYYGMEVDKVAQSGWALTSDCPQSITSTTIRGQIATQLEQASMASYDYVMLEGGCNDVLTYTNGDQTVMNSKWGEIQTANDAVLDDTTIAGAMQELIVKAHAAYPNAKLVYIINSEYGLFDADQENIYHNEAKLAQMIKDVCMLYKEKGYDINYIDLSNTTVYPELVPLSKENARLYPDYTPDRLHPNAASYELSTPVIANFLREVGTGKLPEEVYVSSTGITTLNDAIDAVVDGGTVYIQDAYAVESTFAWEEHGKKVTIKGADATASLSFANVLNGTSTEINVKDDVIFSDITLGFTTSGNQYVMANGHDFIVKDDVTFTGNSIKLHGGGSGGLVVDSTRLELYAGNYTEIYGGGSSGTVNYDTNIIIGGDVNSHLDITEYNTASYLVFGGVRDGTVKGNTNITVEGNAKFYFIYGGSRDDGAVNGSTNITFSGNAYSIYGGSCKGTVDETHVEILGGNVYQVFGGCEKTSMTGTTDVQLLGGNVLRRVYGGCYNEYDSGWKSTNHVTGNTSVTIGPNVTFSLSDDDRGIFAGSRYKEAFGDEIGTVIFVDGFDNENIIGRDSGDWKGSLTLGSPLEYSYLVKATANGNVYAAGNTIYVVPNSGYTATVTNKDGSALSPTEEGGAYYALADATLDTINVTFTASAE